MKPILEAFSDLKSVKALYLPKNAINNENFLEENYPNVRELSMYLWEGSEDPLSL
jgi:hypothetical protein